MSTDRIDHTEEALSRIATQYTESARFIATLSKMAGRLQELEDALIAVRDITDIDSARGVQLDILGDIVGVSRVIPGAIKLPFFGFADTSGADTFGEEGFLTVGARFREELESYTASTTVGDPELRLMIRAKIVKNHSKGTCDDILAGMNFIFEGEDNAIEDIGGMRFKIAIGRALTTIEKIIVRELDLLPRPAGVQLAALVSYISGNFFGFADQLTAKGFADAPSGGGIFAEEF